MVKTKKIHNSDLSPAYFITYDDSNSIAAKFDYIRQKHLGGMIIYELGWGYPPNSPNYPLLEVYDVLGREVSLLVDGEQNPGSYTVRFDGSPLASGVYFYRLTTSSGFTEVRKMILEK